MTSIYPVFKEGGKGKEFFNIIESMMGLKILPFTCGRSAIVRGLNAVGLNRMDEILVPPYLGQCVLSALSRVAFPTMSPSLRTKAILIYHQFGFPQDITHISSVARDKGWIILNDCANTLFTKVNGKFLVEGGDFTIISLSKLYPCGLGGGFYCRRTNIYEKVLNENNNLSDTHKKKADHALEQLIKINSGFFGVETVFEINSLYGYLPDLVAVPKKVYSALPSTKGEIEKDITHRKGILSIVKEMFPDRTPLVDENEEIVPFAVPITGDASRLNIISNKIKEVLSVDVPVLHFDVARNMLNPDYRKSLVVGCHEGWSEELVVKICEMIKRGIV